VNLPDIPVPVTEAPESPEPWVVTEEPNGVWSASINLDGEWIPLGYFGARQDAEETIAACLHPPQAPAPKVS